MKRLKDHITLSGERETITIMDFRRSPGEVLTAVTLGKVFIVTKLGKPVAMICSPPCDLSKAVRRGNDD